MAGDPDWRIWGDKATTHTFTEGVGIGTRAPLPRTPSVYERKVQWRSYEDSLEVATPHSKHNYPSVAPNLEDIKAQFREEQKEDLIFEITDEKLLTDFPGMVTHVAALAALRKSDDSFRIIHDGTHGVLVNPRIIVRDQMRCPGTREQKVVMRHCIQSQAPVFALKGDVKKAHRRVKVVKEDWGEQACRLEPGSLWPNKVGTFGVGSAAYWWSRAIGGIGRLSPLSARPRGALATDIR